MPLEKLPLVGKDQRTSGGEAVQVVANVQITKRDSVCLNTDHDNLAERYVGHVTHYRSKNVSLNCSTYEGLTVFEMRSIEYVNEAKIFSW